MKSNAIVYAKDGATIGVGAGQMSRVELVPHRRPSRPSTPASTSRARSWPPTPSSRSADGLDAAAEAGITAIIQPGGSMRDEEVIAAADEHGLAMVFTGLRHFRH